MLSNAVSYIDAARGTSTLSNTSTAIDEKFIDRDAVASWAQAQVALMTNNNIMTGRDNGIAPLDNTTIQEAVILILRMNGLFA